jgi:hypothetical protein
MGQTGSRVAGKIASSFSFSGGEDYVDSGGGAGVMVPRFLGKSVIVISRRG